MAAETYKVTRVQIALAQALVYVEGYKVDERGKGCMLALCPFNLRPYVISNRPPVVLRHPFTIPKTFTVEDRY